MSNTATVIANEHFHWISGEKSVSTYVKDTGFRSAFCTTCGSTVPNPLRDTPYYWVPSGMFDASENLEIVMHIYVGSRAAWDTAPLNGIQHDTMPETLDFIQALHAR